jgi:hypothetical protein
MYTVIVPENSYLTPVQAKNLRDAIKEKLALQMNYRIRTAAIILDCDNYIVSTKEQWTYIIANLG